MLKRFFAIPVLVLAALACNWSDIAPLEAPVIEPSPLPTFAMPTIPPTLTETPFPTPTSTPDAPIAWAGELGVNCRYGPGKEWALVSTIPAGTIAQIKGRTVDTSWWFIEDTSQYNTFCWVSYDVMETAGNMNIIPIVEIPEAAVTDVTTDATVSFTACGASNEVTFNGSITTNGPISVTYHWNIEGDAQYTTEEKSLKIGEAGTQKLAAEVYMADCGNYTLTLWITSPNEISAHKGFKIQAPSNLP